MWDAWPLIRWALAAVLATYIGVNGLKKKSLNRSGAIAGFAVGFVSAGLSLRLGLTLILFYKSSSMLTKVGAEKKLKLTDDYKEGGQRGAAQVLSCSLFATIVALVHRVYTGQGDSLIDFEAQPLGGALLCAYLGFYACCAGDTWSSEIGVLSKKPPRLVIRPWQVVPHGTNGGISLEGTVAAALAGLFMGFAFFALGWAFRVPPPLGADGSAPVTNAGQVGLIALGVFSGLTGSFLDSLMGALCQASYFDCDRNLIVEHPSKSSLMKGELEVISGHDWLSNEQINILSAVVTSIGAGLVGGLFV